MKIGLDFDGVVADCGQLKADGARLLYGADISPDKFKKEIVVGKGYLTSEQYVELQQKIYESREIGLKMHPVAGMLEILPLILRNNHAVQVITSRSQAGTEIAKDWLVGQGLELDFISVGPGNSKAESVHGLDLYIDDDFEKLAVLTGEVGRLCLFSWGYNRDVSISSDVIRVASWQDVYTTVQELEQTLL